MDVQALGVCFSQKTLTRIFCFVFLCIFVLIVVSFLMEVFFNIVHIYTLAVMVSTMTYFLHVCCQC